jgi:hypothetical protein
LRSNFAATGALVKESQEICSTHSISKAILCSESNDVEYLSEEMLTALRDKLKINVDFHPI